MESSSMRHEMHNSVALCQDGEILAVYRKVHLPVEENHYFVPGDRDVVVDTRIGRVALSICYDLVFPESARAAALQGAEILLVCSNWLGIANLPRLGAVLPVARALEEQLHVVFVNGVGELEVRGRRWNLFGASTVVSATGAVVAAAGPDEQVLDAQLWCSDLDEAALVFPVLRDRRPDVYAPLTTPSVMFSVLGLRGRP
jgi:N-carbamoylputrescine amidase